MKKSTAIISMIIFVLLTAGLGYMACFGVGQNKVGSASTIKQGLDLAGGVSITYQVVGEEAPSDEDMSDTIYKLQKRVEKYSTESQVYKEGTDRINIEIPGVSDANSILEELGNPGTLYFIKQTDADGNMNYSPTVTEEGKYTHVLNRSIEDLVADGSAFLTGTDVVDAQPAYTQTDTLGNKEYVVQLKFTEQAKEKFKEATTYAYNNNQTIAIYYDGEFISVPGIETPITDGEAIINGMESFEVAEKLASQIRIGGLKVQLTELRSSVVGAQLGEEAINTSLLAGAIGCGLVAVFMIVIYWIPGVASVLALLAYIILTILCLVFFEITLTLPGIAGIILSVGMAVDANVIIFARIREELATGKTVQSSINIGFKKATSAILDGNITTLIAALVLGLKGSGGVKGFAQTLAIGIIISMFSAMVISRFVLNAMYAMGCKNEKLYGMTNTKKTINFLKNGKIFLCSSLLVIVIGFVCMGVNKAGSLGEFFNYSLEFKGGTSTNITFNEDKTIADIDSDVIPLVEEITGDGNVQATKVAGSTEVIIKTRTLSVEEREEMNSMLVNHFAVNPEKVTAETISATISGEMKSDAIVAITIAVICMLIYIWIRFKDLRFGASAVFALLHDVLIVVSFYAAIKLSVGSNFIACLLTIVGYSINATIVVFDRIRENMAERKNKETLKDVVNKSIGQTLSRSLFTSFTTFITVAMLYALGVSSIREFALPLMVGILVGAYSSVCLAGFFWYSMKTKFGKTEE